MECREKRSSNYSFGEKVMNVIFFIRSKIMIPSARLIRFPIVIRGKKWIDFGEKITTGRNCRIEVIGNHDDKCLIFGKNVNMGDNVSIRCTDNITIGDNVLMGSKVLIIDNVWVGEGAVIQKGVKVGAGSIKKSIRTRKKAG